MSKEPLCADDDLGKERAWKAVVDHGPEPIQGHTKCEGSLQCLGGLLHKIGSRGDSVWGHKINSNVG